MAERGNIGGLDFRFEQFPQASVPPQQPVGQQPVQANVPPVSNDPLAVREGLTANYYNNWGLIKSFVEDMAKKGIDPFEPDYSQDGGGLAFQTLQKLYAGMMFASNALQNEFKAEQQMRPLIAQGQVRPEMGVNLNQGMAYSDPNNFYSTAIDPMVTQANQVLSDARYTQSDSDRLNTTVRDPKVARYVQLIKDDPDNATYYQRQIDALLTNTPQIYTPSLIDRNTPGPTPADINGRVELIKQAKQGILNNDPRVLNLIKMSPNVQDATYVNTGDRIGLEIWGKDQFTPTFIDFSQGGGEQELNAYFNRIEGQKNIPNEAILGFDTKVNIPSSNVRDILDGPKDENGVRTGGVKAKIKNLDEKTISDLKQLALSNQLATPNGEPVKSIEKRSPWPWQDDGLIIKYHPIENNKINYNKMKELVVTDPDEIDNFIETNANKIAPAFGGGFVTEESTGLKQPAVVNQGGKKIW